MCLFFKCLYGLLCLCTLLRPQDGIGEKYHVQSTADGREIFLLPQFFCRLCVVCRERAAKNTVPSVCKALAEWS